MTNRAISGLTAATTPLAGTELVPVVQSGITKKVSVDNLTTGKSVPVGNIITGSAPSRFNTAGNAYGTELISIVPPASYNGIGLGISNTDVIGIGIYHGYAQGANTARYLEFTNYIGGIDGVISHTPTGLAYKTGKFNYTAQGVDFTANAPAAGMTSQLLNWYEEGTFTPTVYGSITAGVTTYSSQQGIYRRIGGMCFVKLGLTWTNMTGTGNLVIGGLPFTVTATGNWGSIGVIANNLTYTGQLIALVVGGGTTVNLYSMVTGVPSVSVAVDTAATVEVTGAYFI